MNAYTQTTATEGRIIDPTVMICFYMSFYRSSNPTLVRAATCMRRFVKGPSTTNIELQHTSRLIAHVHAGTLQQELQAGVNYCVQKTSEEAWMTPLGQSAATTTPKAVLSIMNQTSAPDSVKFGGCFGMLNLAERIKPFDELEVGRMR